MEVRDGRLENYRSIPGDGKAGLELLAATTRARMLNKATRGDGIKSSIASLLAGMKLFQSSRWRVPAPDRAIVDDRMREVCGTVSQRRWNTNRSLQRQLPALNEAARMGGMRRDC